MGIKENLYYWEESLKNPEPLIDPLYISDEIIVEDKNLINKIWQLRDLIVCYCVLKEKDKLDESLIEDIYNILTSTDKIQYTEFVAFWKVLDMSYSIFKSMPDEVRKETLKHLLDSYCEKRRKLYDKLGYTDIVAQALYDSGASRKKGIGGINKVIRLLEECIGKEVSRVGNLEDLRKNLVAYFLPDQGDEVLFNEFCKVMEIKYEFGQKHQGKKPDLVVKISERYIVIEAKHIKESGGAQDKQVAELIDFIKQQERKEYVHYLSFMDGLYFNKFIESVGKKVKKQRKDIEVALKRNKKNFFVNTAGLRSLIKDIISTL
ncbi:MAG: hypothetical protein AB1353_02580 [Aquificota bacterium]|jgi:hypothetical protein|uniref:Restriction endonuclease type II DpnII-like domain-containing protein n=1 Tax=Hydrogenobacter sp. TaxID=2152829 RepID=A0A7C2V637_9AQUI|nr:hypothetical protein [Aquificaceae bacterium]MDM7266590.1 hypothetical protein [Aquificaceae bacterium]QWK12447.1 MAG: hypothetical protein KNN14_06210 [Aquificota bacterium]HAV39996.1 hypothetical protein [Aquificaceae bacterium]